MEAKTPSSHILRKRKFLLFLPMLVLPFTTLLFWSLGGGKESDASAGHTATNGSLNMQLPDAHLKEDGSLTKLSYYEKAASDSARLKEQLKNDPYYLQGMPAERSGMLAGDTVQPITRYQQKEAGSSRLNPSPYSGISYTDPNEARVYEKLHALNTALNGATRQQGKPHDAAVERVGRTAVSPADLDRLEQMLGRTKTDRDSEDPEMRQLEGMMDKILDIQHPERVKEKLKQTIEAPKDDVFAVTAGDGGEKTSLLINQKMPPSGNSASSHDNAANGFFSLEDEAEGNTVAGNAIQAIIHETQTIVDGAIVKLRLTSPVTINSAVIPKGSFVFGRASLNGERLTVKINTVRYDNSLYPVQLSVVDMDGMEGIYIPGIITADVAGTTADRTMQSIGITTLDPSLGAKAAGVGIEAAKSLLNRKVKMVKLILKAGYQVLLRDEKQKQAS
ncbi:MAG TPA: conjugative transposon protein TraM [Flavisolibacter sp.]|nr:conjugative transposon protein TraM [Flavisolibacter sp.]